MSWSRALVPWSRALALTLGTVVLAGCSAAGSSSADGAGEAAEAFTAAVTADASAACALLAPQTREELEDDEGPCATSIGELDLPQAGRALEVEAFGLDAMVRTEHDTLFLARFEQGWRVTAAGCEPDEPDRPYTCEIKGG